MKLYEIDQQIAAIFEAMTIDEETGEVILDTEALEALQEARTDKLEGAALYVKDLEALAKAIREEEKALAARRQAMEKKVERIKGWIAYNMGDEKLETARVKIAVRPGSTCTMVNDVNAVVDWYNKTRKALLDEHTETADAEYDRITKLMQLAWPAPTVSKLGLRKLMKDYEIPGVGLFTGAASLVIK